MSGETTWVSDGKCETKKKKKNKAESIIVVTIIFRPESQLWELQ